MRAIFFDCPAFLADLYDDELRAIVPDLAMTVGDVAAHAASHPL